MSTVNRIIVNVIFILIGVSLLVAIGFLGAFIWSVRSGQYEDDYTPSVRMLFDDENPSSEGGAKKNDSAEAKKEDPPEENQQPKK